MRIDDGSYAEASTPRLAVVALRARVLRALQSRRFLYLAVLTLVFVALTTAVVVGSPLDHVDHWVRQLTARHITRGWRHVLLHYVMLGKRGPTATVAAVWFAFVCWRRRSLDPLVRFALALVMLNLFVGVVKLSVGRWGPGVTANAHDVLAGGDIFPSGHVSNAVVLFGVLAMTATYGRRLMRWLAVWVSVTVGIGTIWLDTHWVTDVFGGWMAGGMVLLALPWCESLTHDAIRWIRTRIHLRALRRNQRGPTGRPPRNRQPARVR